MRMGTVDWLLLVVTVALVVGAFAAGQAWPLYR